MSTAESIREEVRRRYAAAATRSATCEHEGARAVESSCCPPAPAATTHEPTPAVQTSCCGPEPVGTTDEQGRVVFGAELYGAEAQGAPAHAVPASLGCGVPTAVADLHPGEVILDLGSGAGADVLISARRIAPAGRVIGLNMTDEMLDLARRNAAEAGVDNVEFLKGYLEDIPLPDASVDVVISNCVINLAADKLVVLAEAFRALRPSGRIAFSDVIADDDMDEATKADMAQWTGCIAGALTHAEFTQALTTAGFTDIEIRPTHRVHAHAQAAIIRAFADPTEGETRTMNIIEVFEPALCCATGVCGEDVDQGLVTFSADLDFVRSRGAKVSRYNLASEPLAFAAATHCPRAWFRPAWPASEFIQEVLQRDSGRRRACRRHRARRRFLVRSRGPRTSFDLPHLEVGGVVVGEQDVDGGGQVRAVECFSDECCPGLTDSACDPAQGLLPKRRACAAVLLDDHRDPG